MLRIFFPFFAALALAAPSVALAADNAAFDLTGPTLRVMVTHDGHTLPIDNVPQLATGDKIEVRADLPDDQSAHYLLIAAFLRGSTNPPTDKWFSQAETWTKKGKSGLSLVVPDGAQQVMLFLAPSTGGDFSTLRNAVQGKPGAFVRAAQDLAQASLDRRRLDKYLAAVRKPVTGDPDRLDRITPLLARSLQIKVNTDCLTKTVDLQAACLQQNQDSLVLNDGHSNEITDALAGPGVDLALQFSATPQGGLGYYSPYIAALRDIIGMFSSLHTAKYQYIPALAMLDDDKMQLVLNAAPSFHNPKSVLVAALPIVAPIKVPPLEIPAEQLAICEGSKDVIIPVSGAPLIYATHYAHELAVWFTPPGGPSVDLPAEPDVEQGGLVVRMDGKGAPEIKEPIKAMIHGIWGFQPFDGPSITLQPVQPGKWRLASSAGDIKQSGHADLTGGASACVARVSRDDQALTWKASGPDRISVTLGDARSAGKIVIASQGNGPAQEISLSTSPRAARPTISLIARDVRRIPQSAPVGMALGDDAEIPVDATLRFSLRAAEGARFTGKDVIEIVAGNGDPLPLTVKNGLILADPQVVIATVQPATAFGPSAYGPLRARVVNDGVASDWVSIGTLVRLPTIHQLTCPADPAAPSCELSGDNLFLIAAVSATPGFEAPMLIPDGYPGNSIRVPRPANKLLYVRWHDDPGAIGHIGS